MRNRMSPQLIRIALLCLLGSMLLGSKWAHGQAALLLEQPYGVFGKRSIPLATLPSISKGCAPIILFT